jgi:anti-sigma regulatory factor (Ser/Thr protein kinase)
LAALVTEATVSAGVRAAEEALILPPQDTSAVRAQRFVRRVLAESDVERDLVDVAVLMTKALVINGILHARSAIAVTVKVAPESIRIEVTDRGRQMLPGAAQSWGMATISR